MCWRRWRKVFWRKENIGNGKYGNIDFRIGVPALHVSVLWNHFQIEKSSYHLTRIPKYKVKSIYIYILSKKVSWCLNWIFPFPLKYLTLNFFNSVEKWAFLFSDSEMGSFHWSWWLPLSKALRSWPFPDHCSLFTGQPCLYTTTTTTTRTTNTGNYRWINTFEIR